MNNFYTILLAALILSCCAPPRTTLEQPQTGQVVTCDANGEEAGGVIAYSTDKTQSRKCVEGAMKQGYDIISIKR